MVQGGTQALSRSLFATLIPAHKSGEFFGFYSVFEKFVEHLRPAALLGDDRPYRKSRNAILSVIAFFAIGAVLLAFVDVERGQRAARDAEEGLRLASN